MSWRSIEGSTYPLGSTWIQEEGAYNFAVYAGHALSVTLCFYVDGDIERPSLQIHLDPLRNKTEDIWHCRVKAATAPGALYYTFRTTSDPALTGEGTLYPAGKDLLDPYARALHFPPKDPASVQLRVLAMLPPATTNTFDWGDEAWPMREHDLLIYEVHVRGFTKNINSNVSVEKRGTYLGIIEKIPYLQQLGVTAVELMPVFAFDPDGVNYWGYMPISFFAPHCSFASEPAQAVDEFRQMVKALHAAKIEVILDVVFNHSAEAGAHGPVLGLKGLDNPAYYLTSGSPPSAYRDLSGTGNTLNPASRPMRRLILDSLRYWVSEMHVDGFRFDLASVLARNADGSLNLKDPPIFAEIAADPMLADVRMIAEPWDAADGYLLGRSFPGIQWMQWNGLYRDLVKRIVRGEEGLTGELATRFYGSDDLFPGTAASARHPYQSVNYAVSHDGFTLYDTVAFDNRHNEANGEHNTDGPSENLSWNCGHEGEVGASVDVLKLRRRQVKNFFALLMLSNGTPMIRMGDEFLQTQNGNSNPWNQDNETSWLDWERLDSNQEIFHFVSTLIRLRNAHPSISRSRFWREDITWYGPNGNPDFSSTSHTLAYVLRGASQDDDDLYVMVNMYWEDLMFTVQEPGHWMRVIDTGAEAPGDIAVPGSESALPQDLRVRARSVVVSARKKGPLTN